MLQVEGQITLFFWPCVGTNSQTISVIILGFMLVATIIAVMVKVVDPSLLPDEYNGQCQGDHIPVLPQVSHRNGASAPVPDPPKVLHPAFPTHQGPIFYLFNNQEHNM
jgi:hypothetical protein